MAMRVETSPSYLSSVRDYRPSPGDLPRASYRLRPCHQADLRDVARGVEETNAGIATKYLRDGLLATLSGAHDDDEDIGFVELHDLERFCDRFSVWAHPAVITWRRRVTRCRRAVDRLREAGAHAHASVLHVVYGHPDPSVRSLPGHLLSYLGELAPLARYVPAVEDRRREMARLEAMRLTREPGRVDATRSVPEHWGAGETDPLAESAEEAAEAVRRGAAVRMGIPAAATAGTLDLVRHRERYDWALRATSSGDALRAATAPYGVPPPKKGAGEGKADFHAREAAHEERRSAWDARVAAFAVRAREEADLMLGDASRAYQAAWQACPA